MEGKIGDYKKYLLMCTEDDVFYQTSANLGQLFSLTNAIAQFLSCTYTAAFVRDRRDNYKEDFATVKTGILKNSLDIKSLYSQVFAFLNTLAKKHGRELANRPLAVTPYWKDCVKNKFENINTDEKLKAYSLEFSSELNAQFNKILELAKKIGNYWKDDNYKIYLNNVEALSKSISDCYYILFNGIIKGNNQNSQPEGK